MGEVLSSHLILDMQKYMDKRLCGSEWLGAHFSD